MQDSEQQTPGPGDTGTAAGQCQGWGCSSPRLSRVREQPQTCPECHWELLGDRQQPLPSQGLPELSVLLSKCG